MTFEPMDGPGPKTSALGDLRDDPTSRKRFLRMMGPGGASGLAVLLAACGGDDKPAPSTSAKRTPPTRVDADLKIVNFVLTLERVEADFYQQVIHSGIIKDKQTVQLMKMIGKNERDHVVALLAMAKKLGRPALRPTTFFVEVLKEPPEAIIKTAALLENLGASAYLGQAAAIQSKEILAAALSIHSVEARHAAALNELAGNAFKGDKPLTGSVPDGPFAKPMTMAAVLKQLTAFLA